MIMATTAGTSAPASGIAYLAERLNALCDAPPFHTGWYFKDLRTGEEADRFGHVVVPSASTRKIAILMAALKAVSAGTLSLDQPVTIEARYQISTSGCFQHFRPGFTITLHDVLTMMIIVSDNACTGTIADMLGLDAINAFSRSIGMVGTTHREGIPRSTLRQPAAADASTARDGSASGHGVNETTPTDVGLLLELILRGSTELATATRLGCTPELCRLALDILSWQKLNTRLPLLLPAGTKVAHKTGTGAHCYNDAGIVYRGGGPDASVPTDSTIVATQPAEEEPAEDEPRFILTVYTNQVPRELPDGASGSGATSLLIANLARTCWDALP